MLEERVFNYNHKRGKGFSGPFVILHFLIAGIFTLSMC